MEEQSLGYDRASGLWGIADRRLGNERIEVMQKDSVSKLRLQILEEVLARDPREIVC